MFGSRAPGDAHEDSDVDLLVVVDQLRDKALTFAELCETLQVVGSEVEPVVRELIASGSVAATPGELGPGTLLESVRFVVPVGDERGGKSRCSTNTGRCWTPSPTSCGCAPQIRKPPRPKARAKKL